jgi:hypothetical protein
MVCATGFVIAPHAWAQMNLPPSVSNFQGITGAPTLGAQAREPTFNRPAAAPPAGLPGAQSNPGSAAPAAKPGVILEPTDALFDAINRGDIAAARDAISRGADLNGHNVLGMTPIQLSVDLARNDITFLLLSFGGGQTTAPAPASAAKLLAGHSVPAKPTRQAERRPTRVIQRISAPAAPRTPRLFAGDGGTPIPTAGFLGFDPGR